MTRVPRYSLLSWLLLCGGALSAAPASLQNVVAEAVAHNPDIAAARSRWQSAESQVRVAQSLPPPSLDAEYNGFPGAKAGEAEEKRFGVTQTIPFPGKRRLFGRAAAQDAGREEQRYEGIKRDVVEQVKQAYFGLLYARRAVDIYTEAASLVRRFARIAESRYGVGKTSQTDALRAQVELSKTENGLLAARQDSETALARLNTLLNRDPETSIEPLEPAVVPVTATLPRLEATAIDNRPEVREADQQVRRMDAQLAAEKAGYWPDATVQIGQRKLEGESADHFAMVSVELPFLWFGRQRGAVAGAAFDKDEAENALRSAQNDTRYDVREFLTHVQTSQRLLELYRTTILPQAEQAVRVAETAYQSGRVSFLDLLDSERALIEFRLEQARAVSDYGANAAHLERVVGTDLLTAPAPEEGNQHE